jgi:hypothetical protein
MSTGRGVSRYKRGHSRVASVRKMRAFPGVSAADAHGRGS